MKIQLKRQIKALFGCHVVNKWAFADRENEAGTKRCNRNFERPRKEEYWIPSTQAEKKSKNLFYNGFRRPISIPSSAMPTIWKFIAGDWTVVFRPPSLSMLKRGEVEEVRIHGDTNTGKVLKINLASSQQIHFLKKTTYTDGTSFYNHKTFSKIETSSPTTSTVLSNSLSVVIYAIIPWKQTIRCPHQ